jgi:hypothetical protein
VRAHVSDLLGLRQNFKKLIVGKEVKTSKVRTLLLKVVGETLLNDFEVLVGFLELLLEAFLGAGNEDIRALLGLINTVSPS